VNEADGRQTVLDASALLAYFNRERGYEVVERRLVGALLSTVNLAEVAVKLIERGHPAHDVLGDVEGLGVRVTPFTADQAIRAAELRATTRQLGLSLGDRACLALGLEADAVVFTADLPWEHLESPHQIQLIRQARKDGA
jgi:ribonuclease VapC